MRMWNLNPKLMCRNHLLGEHVECHMFVGTLNKGNNIQGYLEKGLLEIHNIEKRHEQLAKEMKRRGYNHNSSLPKYKKIKRGKINSRENKKELFKRCKRCRENAEF